MIPERRKLADRFEAALDRAIEISRFGGHPWEDRATVMAMYVRLQGFMSDEEVTRTLAEFERAL